MSEDATHCWIAMADEAKKTQFLIQKNSALSIRCLANFLGKQNVILNPSTSSSDSKGETLTAINQPSQIKTHKQEPDSQTKSMYQNIS
jgi:hypothetical protein